MKEAQGSERQGKRSLNDARDRDLENTQKELCYDATRMYYVHERCLRRPARGCKHVSNGVSGEESRMSKSLGKGGVRTSMDIHENQIGIFARGYPQG